MVFLLEADFLTLIRPEVKALVVSDPDIYDDCEAIAIEEVKSYLARRYDVDAIFAATGTNRNAVIRMRCVDVFLYHCFARVPGRDVPTIRQTRYDQAIAWLEQVANGDVTPTLPKLPDPDDPTLPKTDNRFGSAKKQSYDF